MEGYSTNLIWHSVPVSKFKNRMKTEILPSLFHGFFFLVITVHLMYPNADSSLGDLVVSC